MQQLRVVASLAAATCSVHARPHLLRTLCHLSGEKAISIRMEVNSRHRDVAPAAPVGLNLVVLDCLEDVLELVGCERAGAERMSAVLRSLLSRCPRRQLVEPVQCVYDLRLGRLRLQPRARNDREELAFVRAANSGAVSGGSYLAATEMDPTSTLPRRV
jgi:hypothetical protein